MADDTTASKPAKGPVTIMRGGTTSSWYDSYVQQLQHDQKIRHAQQDAETVEAKKGLVETASGVQGAVKKSLDLGQPHLNPVAVLQLLSKDGSKERFIQCDVVEGAMGDLVTMTLVLICPGCVGRGIPQSQAQIHIRDDHRKWYLDMKWKGTPFRDPDTGDVLVLAGSIEGPELYKCSAPGCDFAFRISSKTEIPGVSRMVRE
jgi:hypothetical protein